MQIPGLNLLHVVSPVLAPTESPAPSEEQPWLANGSPAQVASDAPEWPNTTSTSADDQQGALQNEPAEVAEEDKSQSIQTDTVSASAIRASPDPLDLALADQSSDSSGHEDAELDFASNDRYRHSLCSTDCSGSSESEDDELDNLIKSAPRGSLQGLEDEYDDNEDGMASKDTGTAGLRTKNEIVEELGPVSLSEVSVTSQTVIEYLGTVEKVMESVAIVRAHTGGEYRILDEGGVIVTESRNVVGTVTFIFGD
jgi:hypothetical protein